MRTRRKPVDTSNPYFRFDNDLCIVCSRCVRACEDTQGTFALDDRRPRHRIARLRLAAAAVPRIRMRVLRRLRRGLSDRRAHGESRCSRPACRNRRSPPPAPIAASAARSSRKSPTARCRAWCRTGRAREPGSCLREGALRLRLRHARGSRHEADDPQAHHRRVARGELGRGVRVRRVRVQAHPGAVRPRLDRRHHFFALHERGNLPRAEAGARGVRHQQRRHLRARLPFADRLRPQAHARANPRARRSSCRCNTPT